jgi:DNA repair protein SbcD/Mre11
VRFLHTSDWHVGRTLRGRSRLEEHEAIRTEVLDIAVRERTDCLLLTGDLFDSQVPSPDSERLVYNLFAELLARGIAAVVIGGNHDHPKRLAAVRQLLDPLGIYIRPEPAAPADGGIIHFSKNNETANIAVLPFVSEKKIVDVCQMMGPEETWYSAYEERIGQMCVKLAEGFSTSTINILLAHLYVNGSQTSGSEREIHVAQPYAVSPQRFPTSAHYIGLGHLHRPQEVLAPSPCCYAGSPLQLDFGEQGQEKRVVLIEARPGKSARLESIGLTSGRRLRAVAGTIEELEKSASSFGQDYLHVTVKTTGPVPGIADRIREILPNALDVRTDYPRTVIKSDEERRHMAPDAMFASFYHSQHGAPATKELIQAFNTLHEEVMDATD